MTRFLTGSVTGLFLIPAAQAADLPLKAKPVEYVKICAEYGQGFWYVPGTQTCMKVGSHVRFQYNENSRGNGRVFNSGAQGRFTRTDAPDASHRVRAYLTVDTRTKTEYGMLRGYIRFGAEQQTPNDPGEVVYSNRFFLQWGGFTVGRAESFFDYISLERYSINNQRNGPNMASTGQAVFGYTWRLGDGFSATVSAEDGGAQAAGANAIDSRSRGKVTVDLDAAPFSESATAVDNGSYAMPDIVGNVRLDQPWGGFMVKGALHQNRGGYYSGFPTGAGVSCTGATANTTQCGHPDDKMGWAAGAGLLVNLPALSPGSSAYVEANYAKGAMGYVARSVDFFRFWGNGRNIGIGHSPDSVFRNGTDLELTPAWSVVAGAEYKWNPQWGTSLYGGYNTTNFTQRGKDMICRTGAFAGTPSAFSNLVVNNCDPDFSFGNIGTRTLWQPHPFLYIAAGVTYWKIWSAHEGTGTLTANAGARAAGVVNFRDEDVVTAHFRVQYDMLP
jgi:porin-like protein